MRRPAPSTITAYLALFLALAGTAWAAASIGSGDVVNNSLKSADLRNNGGVKTADAVNRSLGGSDIRSSSLRGGDFRADSIAGADTDESTLSVSRIAHNLGGAVNLPLTNSIGFKLVPNTAFTQAPTESDQIVGSAQFTLPASCTVPRQVFAYLLLDDPTITPNSTVGLIQLFDSTAGALTRRIAFGADPFLGNGLTLLRTGSSQPHNFFVQAGAFCNSGGGVTLDSVDLRVVGNR